MAGFREELAKSLTEQGLTVSFTPEKGRCLVADRDFFPGGVVISQDYAWDKHTFYEGTLSYG